MTPGRLRSATEALRDNWNTLRNQVLGRGITPRKDLPKKLTDMVGQEFLNFRRWYDSIRDDLFSEMFGAYQREYQVQLENYQRVWALSRKALEKSPKGEKLKAQGLQEFHDPATLSPWAIAAIALGIGLIMWSRR